jgi:hypothetical protein
MRRKRPHHRNAGDLESQQSNRRLVADALGVSTEALRTVEPPGGEG